MDIEKLHEIFLESSGICTDTRKIKKGNLFFALKGENFNGNLYALQALTNGGLKAIIDEEIIEKHEHENNLILVEDVLKTLQELAAYHRKFLNIPIISITGSNGKTTTKELIGQVLSKKFKTVSTYGNLNNHIGVPLTLLNMNKDTEIGIVEMGANHQKEIEKLCEIAQPDYGYITNFGKAHLEGFGGFEGVIKGKSELYNYLIKNKKTIFINYDDEIQLNKSQGADVISFSEGQEANYQITFLKASPFVEVSTKKNHIKSQLIGNYNSKNIAAAVCIGLFFKIDQNAIKHAIESYLPSNNRSQIIEKGCNKIILDAYNANPTSMKAALENFTSLPSQNKAVILGDMFEVGETTGKEHQAIVDYLDKTHFDKMYICGNIFFNTNTIEVIKFKDIENLKIALQNNPLQNMTILVKGSRGMKLERILKYL